MNDPRKPRFVDIRWYTHINLHAGTKSCRKLEIPITESEPPEGEPLLVAPEASVFHSNALIFLLFFAKKSFPTTSDVSTFREPRNRIVFQNVDDNVFYQKIVPNSLGLASSLSFALQPYGGLLRRLSGCLITIVISPHAISTVRWLMRISLSLSLSSRRDRYCYVVG
jgi:hypothetical protein